MSDAAHAYEWRMHTIPTGENCLIVRMRDYQDWAIVATFNNHVPQDIRSIVVEHLNNGSDMLEALEAMFDARHSDGGEWADACLKAKRVLDLVKGVKP